MLNVQIRLVLLAIAIFFAVPPGPAQGLDRLPEYRPEQVVTGTVR